MPPWSPSAVRCSGCESRGNACSDTAIDVGAEVVADVVVDGAVDMSATFVVHVDESTMIILVNIATTAAKSSIPRS